MDTSDIAGLGSLCWEADIPTIVEVDTIVNERSECRRFTREECVDVSVI